MVGDAAANDTAANNHHPGTFRKLNRHLRVLCGARWPAGPATSSSVSAGDFPYRSITVHVGLTALGFGRFGCALCRRLFLVYRRATGNGQHQCRQYQAVTHQISHYCGGSSVRTRGKAIPSQWKRGLTVAAAPVPDNGHLGNACSTKPNSVDQGDAMAKLDDQHSGDVSPRRDGQAVSQPQVQIL